MTQKLLSIAEYDKIEKINAAFAEHVMGWLAVGQRDVYKSNLNRNTKTWQGAPSRTSKLEDVPRYWQSLEAAWMGLDSLLDSVEITLERGEGAWFCGIIWGKEPNPFPLTSARSVDQTPSQAIVRCLLKLAGHPLPEPE